MRKTILSLLLALPLGAVDLAGTWHFTSKAQLSAEGQLGRARDITYVLRMVGNNFVGISFSPSARYEVVDGKVAGNQVTFFLKSEWDTSGHSIAYKGTLDDKGLLVEPADAPPAKPGGPHSAQAILLKKVSNESVYKIAPELDHPPFPPFKPIAPNALAQTPPMGWNSWNKFAHRIDDKTVREIADAMVASGMRDAGYVYVNIDDTWEGGRDTEGNLQANIKFPDMKALADYVHSKGLKLGIYSSPGPLTCAEFAGSYKHEEQDARTWAAWGIDYLKYDWCSASAVYHRNEMAPAYQKMALALRAAGRPIVFSLCQYGLLNVGTWGASAGGNLWRTTGDISDNWESMSKIGFDLQTGREKFAGPGHWNDPDMLEIGNGGMTDTEYRTHMSLWSMLAAPLLAGNDLRHMSAATREILTNKEVIAIDQDEAGIQGSSVSKQGAHEIWKKTLAKGVAVALFNRGAEPTKITVKWSDVGISSANSKVRDLWAHADIDAPAEYTAEVPAHGVVMLKVQ